MTLIETNKQAADWLAGWDVPEPDPVPKLLRTLRYTDADLSKINGRRKRPFYLRRRKRAK